MEITVPGTGIWPPVEEKRSAIKYLSTFWESPKGILNDAEPLVLELRSADGKVLVKLGVHERVVHGIGVF